VAQKFYLQVTSEHFEKAAQNPAQYPAAPSSKERHVTIEETSKHTVFPLITTQCGSLQDKPVVRYRPQTNIT
jgi:hypothetical protein